jgi:diaminopimelate epimerase
MEFFKYEASGNDFIIIDSTEQRIDLTPLKVVALCNRNKGIGADGILLLHPSKKANIKVEYFNQDGTRPEECGNGLRCITLYLHKEKKINLQNIKIQTPSGIRTCILKKISKKGGAPEIIVEMRRPTFERSSIPMKGQGKCIEEPFNLQGHLLHFTCLSLGNPHAITFDPIDPKTRAKIAPLMESHDMFPSKINVGFAKIVESTKIELEVYERGCGFTKACGTGACASVIAGCLTKRLPFGKEIQVKFPQEQIWVSVSFDFNSIRMQGPARRVFKGEVLDNEIW